MDFLEHVDRATIAEMEPLAESDQFAIYAVGSDTYLLVQRQQLDAVDRTAPIR